MTLGNWTVLVYMVADDINGVFTNEGVRRELQAIGDAVTQHPGTKIVVQADTSDSTGVRGSVRNGHFITQELATEHVSGSNDIEEFLRDEKSSHLGDRHLVLFWGHGFGPAGLHYEDEFVEPMKLTTAIRHAFDPRPVDLVTLMSCHMSTIELAFEFEARFLPSPRTKAADFVVASQGLVKVPETQAFPYADLFELLARRPDPKTVGNHLVDSLGATKFKAPFALMDVFLSTAVRDALSELAGLLKEVSDIAPFFAAHSSLSPFRRALHDSFEHARTDDVALIDLVRLGRKLAAIPQNGTGSQADSESRAKVRRVGERLVQVVDQQFVIHRGPRGTGNEEFNGVSAYCPPHHTETNAQNLSAIKRLLHMTDYRKLSLSQEHLGSSWVDVVSLAQ